MAREWSWALWNVPTVGTFACQRASMPREGTMGSWTWRMSNSPSASQRETFAEAISPKLRRATEPLYGTATDPPVGTTNAGSSVVSSAGASTDTSCPSSMSTLAKSRMWNWTPPGASNE